jgi:DNA repair exonuclease SbcCD ATPase subunit
MSNQLEEQLLKQITQLRRNKESLEANLNEVKDQLEKLETRLIEDLTERNATATAKYEGIGHASLVKPRLFASYSKEDEGLVFSYIKTHGEASLIKNTVHPSSFSSFVNGLIQDGQKVPDFINYYLRPQVRIYNKT